MRTMDHQMDHDFDDGMDRGMDRGMGRASYRPMEADAPLPAPEPRDLTLGLTALIGIFFAAVLVCAVFFGFGYSTGRTLHGTKSTAAPSMPATTQTYSADDSVGRLAHSAPAPALISTQPPAKPSAGAPVTSLTTPSAPARDAFDEPAASTAMAPSRRAMTPATSPDAAPASVTARAETAPAAPAGALMVQIAAVMRPADADMLANALRTNGFAAVVRTEPKDKFLHVQVGPFATRDQAKAMRARLEADGYNAFLKP